MTLKSKIITAIALVILITISISTVVVINVYGRRMTTAESKNIEILSGIILRSLDRAMEKGRTDEVQHTIENIGRSRELLSLRIVSPDGYILKSKQPEEIGKKSREFSQVKYNERGQTIVKEDHITNFTPIANSSHCHGCHSPNIKVNGIIEMSYDISGKKTDILAVKKFLIFSNILTVVVVAIILSVLITKLIMKPLGTVMNTIQEIESGNWDARVQIKDEDEVGTIGKAFNNMVLEIKKLYDKNLKKEKEVSKIKVELEHKRKLEELNSHLEYKIKEVGTANKAVLSLSKEVKSKNIELERMIDRLKKINDVGRVLSSIIETDELVKLIIKTTAEMLYVERGSMHLKRSEERKLTLQYKRGIGVDTAAELSLDFQPLYKDLLMDGRTVFISKNNRLQKLEDITTSAIGVPLKMRGQIIGGMLLEEKVDGSHFTIEELELLGTMANQAMVAIENAWLYETVKINYFGTIQALVNALEANDRYTKGHSERVKSLSLELAKYIGLDFKELEVLEHAAILHDIGKIGIDSVILNKVGRLSSDEYSLVRAHPLIGDEILGPIGTLHSVRQTILQHHERYDGTGYPYGIAGDEICLKARILTVVDTFDAMLTDRPYRKALAFGTAKDELRQSSGSQFDPIVVNAFLELIDTNTAILGSLGYNLN